jgi:hypothetical protein
VFGFISIRHGEEGSVYDSDGDEGFYEQQPGGLQVDVDDLMKELGMFRKRVKDDHVRFAGEDHGHFELPVH